jgi:phage baseplate assembly protein W
MAREQIYKDLDLSFDVNPLSGDIDSLRGVDAIKRSLKNLVLYNIFEKPYSSEFDIGLRNLLFENKGHGFQNYLRKRIRILIETYEPRVILNDVLVKFASERNSIQISVFYTAKETQTTETIEFFLGKNNGQ